MVVVDKAPCPFGPLFDSHSHINSEEFDGDRDAVVARMRKAGLVGAMVVACDWGEEKKLFEVIDSQPGFLCGAWALHPEYEDRLEPTVEQIAAICEDPRIAAVGETGLDYYWCKGDLEWQKERFVRHIEAARLLKKPLIVHAREAEADALDDLRAHRAHECGFVLHCYGGDVETARRAVDAGGLISFTGVVTFKNAKKLKVVVEYMPLDRLVLETDCPYLSPVPNRGKRNSSLNIPFVIEEIARIKGIPPETVEEAAWENAFKLYRMKPEVTG